MSFSKRMGLVPQKAIQIDDIDIELRNGIWNLLQRDVFNYLYEYIQEENSHHYPNHGYDFFQAIWFDFFKWNIDDFTGSPIPRIRKWFLIEDWYLIYDFIEFIIATPEFVNNQLILFSSVIDKLNTVLEKEVSAYRIVNCLVAPITNETELKEVEEAIDSTTTFSGYKGANEHIQTALGLLSNRQTPDFRNSIKESICAVESIVGLIIGDTKATLGIAIKKLEKDFALHPSLREAFSKLYGYTSDEGGIRHALSEDSNAGFDEAKFMLVTCSAFVNYVIGKYGDTLSS